MSIDITRIEPLETFIVHDISSKWIGSEICEVCRRLYCDSLAEVAYLILSKGDLELLTEKMIQGTCCASGISIEERKIVKLINRTTGEFMDVFISDQLSAGTAIFGVYMSHLDRALLQMETLKQLEAKK